jgi:hypothetical protein
MLLTMLLFAVGNIPLLSWIKSRTLRSPEKNNSFSPRPAAYGSISSDSSADSATALDYGVVARDLNWFERIDASVLRDVFRRSGS